MICYDCVWFVKKKKGPKEILKKKYFESKNKQPVY